MAKDISQFSIDDLKAYIKELEAQIKQDKKYGLVWDKENTPEQVVLDCGNKIPTLTEDLSKKINAADGLNNILIEGDNFHSLAALSLIKENGIDVIYIDPPYNTGHNDFIYNDKFINEEDGYKHSKWLSFMENRLILARNLLKDSGVIFISIDEHEFAQLKLLCDKIFSEKNFIENFIWIKNATKNLSKTTSTNHEYVLCYAKNITVVQQMNYFKTRKNGLGEVNKILDYCKNNNITIEETQRKINVYFKEHKELTSLSLYKYVDDNYLLYTSDNPSAPLATGTSKNNFDIFHPITNKPCKKTNRGWAFTYEKSLELIANNMLIFGDDETKIPRLKRYLNTVENEVQKSIIVENTDGKKELQALFQSNSVFQNPKPINLIKTLIKSFRKNVILFDFFAGSGTTGQAVLELNKEDGGNRRFILCTNNENGICENVTYPRLKTVITGIRPDGTKYSDGIPANLRYFKTDFVKDQANRDSAKYALVEKCNGLLCILEDCFDLKENKNAWFKYESSDKCMYIFNDYYDKSQFDEMKESIKSCGKKVILYVYSTDETVDLMLIEDLKNVEMKPIPTKIYEIYKEIVESIKRG